jgi:hypothetical protein
MTSFQNAIIIMTSNLGSAACEQRRIGLAASEEREEREAENRVARGDAGYWQRKVEEYFRPEFVNRIDQIVAFQALDRTAMRTIASREIGDVLLRQGLVRRNVLVEVDPGVIDLPVEQGFTATCGARPLKRAIERLVVLPLARFLVGRERPSADLLRLRRAGDQVELGAASLNQSEAVGTNSADPVVGGLDVGRLGRRKIDDCSLSEGFAELRRKLQDWQAREAVLAMQDERATSLAATNKPTFWDDGDSV